MNPISQVMRVAADILLYVPPRIAYVSPTPRDGVVAAYVVRSPVVLHIQRAMITIKDVVLIFFIYYLVSVDG